MGYLGTLWYFDNWYFDTDPHPIRGTYLHFHSVLKVVSSLLLDSRHCKHLKLCHPTPTSELILLLLTVGIAAEQLFAADRFKGKSIKDLNV